MSERPDIHRQDVGQAGLFEPEAVLGNWSVQPTLPELDDSMLVWYNTLYWEPDQIKAQPEAILSSRWALEWGENDSWRISYYGAEGDQSKASVFVYRDKDGTYSCDGILLVDTENFETPWLFRGLENPLEAKASVEAVVDDEAQYASYIDNLIPQVESPRVDLW